MKYSNPDLDSSYRPNDIGKTLYDTILKIKPQKVIEFGVLHGYSTIAMAMALHEIGAGKIYAYDLWEKYPYKHTTLSNTEKNIKKYGLEDFVELRTGDAHSWQPEKFSFMHIDISHDGEVLKQLIEKFSKFGDTIAFEGGTTERDNIEWMKKYKKKPITGSFQYELLNEKFPGLSIVNKVLSFCFAYNLSAIF